MRSLIAINVLGSEPKRTPWGLEKSSLHGLFIAEMKSINPVIVEIGNLKRLHIKMRSLIETTSLVPNRKGHHGGCSNPASMAYL